MKDLRGETISHYRVVEAVGRGGMGDVYKAQDLRLGRHVALKFLPPGLTRDPESKERFVHEAKAASSLQHENICVIHDIEETPDGQTFIVLEFCEGETIKQKIARNPLPVDDALRYAIQVGDGLAEAHRHGIVHRDIKPANVMITSRGKAKIVDFGVALLAGSTRLTTDGRKVGTVTHMSPEQARGELVDHRSDIWSLGVLLYEMLTGRLPFESSYEQALVYSILNLNPVPISSLRHDVPQRLDEIIQKALAKNVDARYQTAEEMVSDLQEIAGPSTGSGSSGLSAATPALKRRRAWLIAGTTAILSIVVGGIWLFRGDDRAIATGPQQVRILLLDVRNETGNAQFDNWATVALESFLPTQLVTGRNTVLLGKESAADESDFELEGRIITADSTYILQLLLKSSSSGIIQYITEARFGKPAELQTACGSVARSILLFDDLVVLRPDLEPWLSGRMLTDSAAEMFVKAAIYVLTGEEGGGVFLNECIRIDSTFVAPRVWLIPGLLAQHSTASRSAAEEHYRVLRSLRSRVTPFELSMIELAGCYFEGDLPCRVAALEKGLRFAPGNRIVLENLGTQYYRLERYAEAASAYEPLVRSGMSYPPLYPEYARALIKLKDFDGARTVLDSARTLLPVDPDTYGLLAAFSWKVGDSARAKTCELSFIQGVERKKRGNANPYEVLGRSLLDLGAPRRALQYLRIAIHERGDVSSSYCALGLALLETGDTTSAESQAREAVARNASCPEAHLLIGDILERRGEISEARRHFQKYLEIDSVTVTARELQKKLIRTSVIASER